MIEMISKEDMMIDGSHENGWKNWNVGTQARLYEKDSWHVKEKNV